MGQVESDELTNQVNLQSFSSPYSPQFFLNKNDFKGQSIKQVINEYLNSDITNKDNNSKSQDSNKELKDINTNKKNHISTNENKSSNQKDAMKMFNSSIPSLSTLDEEIKNTNNNIILNSISISTKKEIIKKQEKEAKINKIIIEDENNNTQTTIFTITSSLQTDINKVYKFKEVIGKGSFGIVRTGYRIKEISPHKIYAIKSIDKTKISQNVIDNLEKEIDIISSLDHPNIARFYETFHDQRYFHIVTELCRGKELSKLLKQNDGKIKEKNCRIIIMKIIHAINYCHIHGVVHCDLKPDNIIFETPNEESENDNDNILNF